jgi:hypothetical protein
MRTVRYFALAVLTLGLVAGLGFYRAQGEKPKFTIKQIMDKAHESEEEDNALRDRAIAGKLTKQEKEELLALYIALSQNKPPKGDEKDWKERTDKIVAAAKDLVAGKEGAPAALKAATNCGDCHSLHRPKKGS